MVVPVRIEGLEATIFSRLSRAQVRRRWFPKVRVTVLEPVRLTVDDALKGKARRQAAGAMLYQIMSDLIFRTTPTDRTVIEAVVEAAKIQGWGRIAVEDPVTGKLSYRKLLIGARVLAGKFEALAGEGEAVGVMLPNANGAAATLLGMMSAGRVPAMINFTAGVANIQAACTAAEVRTIVTSRALCRAGEARQAGRCARRDGPHRLSRGSARDGFDRRQDPRAGPLSPRSRAAQRRRSGRDPVHLRLGGHAKGCRALPSQHAVQCGPGRGAHRLWPHRQGVQHIAGVPRLRADRRAGSAAGVRGSGFSLPLAAALPRRPRIGLWRECDDPVRHRHLSVGLRARGASLRFSLGALRARRCRAGQGGDAAAVGREIRPAHSRGLRGHRNGAGTRPQHADVQPLRHGRAAAARHRSAARSGSRHRGRRTALRARPQRHARLPQSGSARCTGAAGRRLARHRRYRDDRPRRLCDHQRPCQALCQDRRRDDLARSGRKSRIRAVARRPVGCRHRTRSAPRRTARAGHRRKGRDACRLSGLCQEQRGTRFAGAGRGDGRRQIAGPRVGQGRSR